MKIDKKIEYSLELIKKYEKLSLSLDPDNGYYVAFSGGKDSQVMYDLFKIAGVKFQAHMNLTTVDPPEVLSFIREKYPDVILHRPEKSMFQLIEKKGLPNRVVRFCCEALKEQGGLNKITAIGIRKAESIKRSKRLEFTDDCKKHSTKFLLSPILEWSDAEVWEFLKTKVGYWCKLYDEGKKRIGCIGCPMSNSKGKKKDFAKYPKFEYAYRKAIHKRRLLKPDFYEELAEEEIFDCWISGLSKKTFIESKKQMKIDFKN